MGLLDGKVAIITGGGKGIGFGIASAFAEEGANLCITGRNEQRLIDAEAKLKEQYGVDVMHVAAEGSDEEAVKNVIAQTIAHFGKLDTVVNNAQASKSGVMLVDHSKEEFDLAINSGLYAAFFYMKHAFPELKKTKGSVVNLSSGAGLFGKPGQSSYAAAKEGIRGMTRVAATEWGPDGVRANVICPLAMTEQLAAWKEEYPDTFAATIKGIPLGRFGDPKTDIAPVAVFLASDMASYVSGETITIQGGSGLRPVVCGEGAVLRSGAFFVPMLQLLCPKGACRATCAKGSCWSTNANGAGRPRVPHPCEPACVRGRSPGKMLRRCAPERSAMAICCLGAFLSVQPWQYIVLMHSRAFGYGGKLPWCIPEGATDGKNAS